MEIYKKLSTKDQYEIVRHIYCESLDVEWGGPFKLFCEGCHRIKIYQNPSDGASCDTCVSEYCKDCMKKHFSISWDHELDIEGNECDDCCAKLEESE